MDLNFKSLRDNPSDLLRIMRISRGESQASVAETSGYCSNSILKWEHNPIFTITNLIDIADSLNYEVEITLKDKN